MAVTNYYSVDGLIWGESTSYAGIRDYGHDALGSVTETFTSGAVENTYRYKPYGATLARPEPRRTLLFWNGGSGYRVMDLSAATHYVRARSYCSSKGLWTSGDPLWPDQPGWCYAACRPTTAVDPTGLLTATPQCTWTLDCCVGYVTYISWANVPSDPIGYIIQSVTSSGSQQWTCNGPSEPFGYAPYFEAWPTYKGVVSQGPDCPLYRPECRPANDIWGGAGEGVVGSWAAAGIAIYVKGTPTGFGGFIPYGATMAGCLLSTYTWDDWPLYLATAAYLGRVAFQSVDWNWDCCCDCLAGDTCQSSISRTPSSKFDLTASNCPCITCMMSSS